MDAGGQEGKGLEHALDMRIFALTGFEQESSGDLGIAMRKLCSGVPEEAKLALVINRRSSRKLLILDLVSAASDFKDSVERQTFRQRIDQKQRLYAELYIHSLAGDSFRRGDANVR